MVFLYKQVRLSVLFAIVSVLVVLVHGIPESTPKTAYNEVEARALLNLAAAAYAPSPDACLQVTFLSTRPRVLYAKTRQICDDLANTCGSYTLADDANQQLYVVFRGTRSKLQLLTEGWQSKKMVDFLGVGKANVYFSTALDSFWANVESALVDHPGYTVTFTGHSLGGALASLAALRTAVQGLRNSSSIKLVTFGQPRVGNVELAQSHDKYVPYSFRVVHSVDIVPHLPACAKWRVGAFETADSRPCNTYQTESPYHHGIEIYYPHEMNPDSPYRECLGTPFGEDYNCSDALIFRPEHHFQYTYAHRHYFEHKVPAYGKLGCVGNRTAEEKLPNEATDASELTAASSGASGGGGGWWTNVKSRLADIINTRGSRH